MKDNDETPKGADDALVEGYEMSETSVADEVAMLAEAAEQAEGDHISQLLEPLANLAEGCEVKVWSTTLKSIGAAAANLDRFDRVVLSSEIVKHLKRLKVPKGSDVARTLLAPNSEDETNETGLNLKPTEPHTEAVEGVALLDEVESIFKKYLVMPEGGFEALALWVVHTYLIGVFQVTPRLAVLSPMKRCGKSTVLILLSYLVEKPLTSSGLSGPVMFRTMESFHPTLIADEADTWLKENEELRGVVNAGYLRPMAGIIRCSGDDHEPKVFDSFGAMAIAAIGGLPDTIHDRSVVVSMRRKFPGENVQRLRVDRLHLETHDIKSQIARWALDNAEDIRSADPEIPSALQDRAADLWRPLLAIADLAGGDWPARARRAALVLSGAAAADDKEIGSMLLSDIRDIFNLLEVERISTQSLRGELLKLEERPWPSYGRQEKEITPRSLGNLISRFKIESRPMKIKDDFGNAKTQRGYDRASFEESWNRYLQKVPLEGGDPYVTTLPSSNDGGLSPKPLRYLDPKVTQGNGAQTARLSQGNVVTQEKGGGSEEKEKLSYPAGNADDPQRVRRTI
jgi:putative DNA primase/helicase